MSLVLFKKWLPTTYLTLYTKLVVNELLSCYGQEEFVPLDCQEQKL